MNRFLICALTGISIGSTFNNYSNYKNLKYKLNKKAIKEEMETIIKHTKTDFLFQIDNKESIDLFEMDNTIYVDDKYFNSLSNISHNIFINKLPEEINYKLYRGINYIDPKIYNYIHNFETSDNFNINNYYYYNHGNLVTDFIGKILYFTSNSYSNQNLQHIFIYEDKDKLINDVLEYRYPIFHKIHNKYFNKE